MVLHAEVLDPVVVGWRQMVKQIGRHQGEAAKDRLVKEDDDYPGQQREPAEGLRS